MKAIIAGPSGKVGLRAKEDPLKLTYDGFKEFGDYYRIKVMPGISWYVISDPLAVEHILVRNSQNYTKTKIFTRAVNPLMGNGVLNSTDPEEVSTIRKQLIPHLLFSSLDKFSPQIRKAWESKLNEELKEGVTEIEIFRFFLDMNFSVFGELLLGKTFSSEEWKKPLEELLSYVYMRMHNPLYPPPWFPTRENREFIQTKKKVDQNLWKVIEERLRSPSDDLLSVFLTSFPSPQVATEKKQWLIDQIYTLIFAAHDTTGTAFGWILHLLTQYPNERVRLEKDFSKGSDHYFKLVLNEGLRLYPTAWSIPRVAMKEDVVNGWRIPKGKMIILPQYVIHRHPRIWENPEVFLPSRFENFDLVKNRYNYFPFGVGGRMCLGNHLTFILGRELFSILFKHYKVRTLEKNLEIQMLSTSTLRPRDGIHMEFQRL